MASNIYGLIAEFSDGDQLLRAAHRARQEGYRCMDAYTPLPVHGLAEAIGFNDARVPWTIFICGVLGALIGYGLQYYTSVIDYPMNVGGRPHYSWPAWVPVTFECAVLLAAFGAVFGMLAFNGLPRPHHPIFNARHFERASEDRFFLCIEADDPQFDPVETRRFLESLGPDSVSEVERDED
ncbi:MAG TPA: DUF3341 domain-containing protein [Chthonomonadales bacterium]|nr:DUF3341 domain-containing protein [Chthonomonadales bacterium]